MRKNKGFTLIELMIVIAIIAIIAAIAIPNLLQSRIRANESNAVTQIRNYAAAQSIFNERNCGLLIANIGTPPTGSAPAAGQRQAYSAQYDTLYYGNPVVGASGAPATGAGFLRLINVAHANATIRPSALATAATALPQAFNGYTFNEPVTGAAADFYLTRYALMAFPENSDRAGAHAYYFDDNGTVMSYLLASGLLNPVAASGGPIDTLANPVDGTMTGWTY